MLDSRSTVRSPPPYNLNGSFQKNSVGRSLVVSMFKNRLQYLFLAILTPNIIAMPGPLPSEARFEIRRPPLEMRPSQRTIILGNTEGDLVFSLHYQGAVDHQMRIRATLTGPGMNPFVVDEPASQLKIVLDHALFSEVGDYRLSNVRIEKNGQLVAWAEPRSATIAALPEILVTRVQVKELDQQELSQLGYIFNKNDYQAVEFKLAMVMGAKEEEINIPVAIPRLKSKAFLPVVLEDPLYPAVQVKPMISVPDVFYQEEAGQSGPTRRQTYDVFSLLLIPGNFSYLKTHFSVTCIVANVAPEGVNAQITNLKAELKLPAPTEFGFPITIDGSLIQEVAFPGGDGIAGTVDDRNALSPGEEGRAEYIVRGEVEGLFPVKALITGELELDGETREILSVGEGRVLVRHPDFTVTLEHPDTVAENEPYDLVLNIHNKGQVPLEGLQVALNPNALIGAALEGGNPVQQLGTIAPGEEGQALYSMRALVTGEVVASYFKVEGGVTGQLDLQVGVGQTGERFSPIAVVFPESFYRNLPTDLALDLKRYAKKLLDFAQMNGDELPEGITPINNLLRAHLTEELALAAKLIDLGTPEREALIRLFSTWVRSKSDDEAIDRIRRKIVRESGAVNLELHFGTVLSQAFANANHDEVLQSFVQENEQVEHLALILIDHDQPITLTLKGSRGRTASTDGSRDLPFSTIIPLGPNRTLAWAGGPAPPTVEIEGAQAEVSFVFLEGGEARAYRDLSFALDPSVRLAYLPEQEALLTALAGRAPQMVTGESVPKKAFDLIRVKQMDNRLLPGADRFGRHLLFLFTKAIDLESLNPIDERLFINGEPAVDAEIQRDGRSLLVSARMPIGPYVANHYSIKGARSVDGQRLENQTGVIETSSHFSGVRVAGRVVDHAGADLGGAKVFLYQRWTQNADTRLFADLSDPRLAHLGTVGRFHIFEETQLDEEGAYRFNFVALPAFQTDAVGIGRRFKIGVLLEDGRYEEREFYPRGVSQEVRAEFAFVRQGQVIGHVRSPSGAPIPFAPIFIQNQNNLLSSAIATADAEGFYRVDGIEVGRILVKSRNGQYLGYGSGYLSLRDNPAVIDVVIDDQAFASMTGKVAFRDGQGVEQPLEGAFVGVLVDDTFDFFSSELSYDLPYTVGGRTGPDGAYQLNEIPTGQGHLLIFHPQFSLERRAVFLNEGANAQDHVYTVVDMEGGSVSGVAVDDTGAPAAHATVEFGGQIVAAEADGSFTLDSVPLFRNVTIHASLGEAEGHISVYLDLSQRHLVNQQIILYEPAYVSGAYVDAQGNPRVNHPIHHFVEGVVAGPCDQCEPFAWTDENGYWHGRVNFSPTDLHGFTGINPPYLSEARNIFVDRGNVTHVDLRERATAPVTVQLQDALGNPVVGEVTLTSDLPDSCCATWGVPIPFSRTLITDGAGRITVENVNIGDLSVLASHILLGQVSATEPLTAAGAVLTLAFPESELGSLFGRVYDTDGVSPAPPGTQVFARVNVTSTSGPSHLNVPAVMDDQGYYRFDSLVETATPHQVSVVFFNEAAGLVEETRLQLHQNLRYRRDAILKGTGAVRVRVTYADGSPVDHAAVHLAYRRLTVTHGASGPTPTIGPVSVTNSVSPTNPVVVFGDIPAGPILVKALGPNGLSGSRAYAMPVDGQDLELTVRLEASSDISGFFINHGGAPIGDAEVQLRHDGLLQQILTDNAPGMEGAFAFHHIPMRTYTIFGTDPTSGLTGQTKVTTSPFQPVIEDLVLQLDPVADLEGIVRDSDGAPVSGATVEVSRAGGDTWITGADTQGRYQFKNLKLGSWSVKASHRTAPAGAATSIVLDQALSLHMLDLQFERTVDLRVQILESDMSPASRVLLSLYNARYGQHSTFTDGDGRALFPKLPNGLYHLTAEDGRTLAFFHQEVAITDADGETTERTLHFPGHGSVRGQVLDRAGQPISQSVLIEFSYVEPSGTFGQSMTRTRTISTDADGNYRVGRMPVGQVIRFNAYHPTTYEWAQQNVQLDRHEQEVTADLIFRNYTTVSGTVLYSDGTPAARATVRITDPVRREVLTDNLGRFFMEPVPEGNILFTAEDFHSSRLAKASILAAPNPQGALSAISGFELRLAGLGSINGHVTYSDGGPVISGQVHLLNEVGEPVQAASIYGDGSYRFHDVPLGQYHLKSYDSKYARESNLHPITLDGDGQAIFLNISFEPSYTFSGRVIHANGGAPVIDGLVELWRLEGTQYRRIYSDAANDQGFFTIDRVYPGLYRIEAASPDLDMALTQDLVFSGDTQLDLHLQHRSWIIGVVTDGSGRPFNGGTITVIQEGKTHATQVEADGDFRIEGLLPTSFNLSAEVANGWITAQHSGFLNPGLNNLPIATVDTATVSGQVYFLGENSLNLSAYLLKDGVRRALTLDPSGQFSLNAVPHDEEISLQLFRHSLVRETPLGRFYGDADIGVHTLDSTPPEVHFAHDGQTVNLPWNPQFFLTEPEPDSLIDGDQTRIWINDQEVSRFFQATGGVISALFEHYPPEVVRGPNRISIRAYNDSNASAVHEYTFNADQNGTHLIVEMHHDGAPTPGLLWLNQEAPVQVDATGRAVIYHLPTGLHQLKAAHAGAGGRWTVDIQGNVLTQSIPLRLENTGDYFGRILNLDGTPAVGAMVAIGGFQEPTDANGEYYFDLLPLGRYLLTASKDPHYAQTSLPRLSLPGQAIAVDDLALLGSGAVQGVVYDHDGATPIPDAEVILSFGGLGQGLPDQMVTSDALGFYRFENVRTYPVSVMARHTASLRSGSTSGALVHPGNTLVLDVSLYPSSQVVGVARHASGQPLSGHPVVLKGADTAWRSETTTQSDGSFSLDGLPEGFFLLEIINVDTQEFLTRGVDIFGVNLVEDLGDLALAANQPPELASHQFPDPWDPDFPFWQSMHFQDDFQLDEVILSFWGAFEATLTYDIDAPAWGQNGFLNGIPQSGIPEGVLYYSFTIIDWFGSTTTVQGDLQVAYDADGPQITLLQPANGAVFQEGDPVEIRFDATDPHGVDRIDLLFEGESLASIQPPEPLEFNAYAPAVEVPTDLAFEIRAYDGQGHVSSWPVNIHVLPIATSSSPQATLLSPLDGMPQPLSMNPGLQLRLVADLEDPEGLAYYEWRINSSPVLSGRLYGPHAYLDQTFEIPVELRQLGVLHVSLWVSDVGGLETLAEASVVNISGTVITQDLALAEYDLTYDGHTLILAGGRHRVDGTHRFADLILANGARVSQTETNATQTTVARTRLLIDGHLAVGYHSEFDMDGAGYPGLPSELGIINGQASHGGLGRNGSDARQIYGSPFHPEQPGSMRGGGAVHLAAEDFWLAGAISARPAQGLVVTGSGGSIWLEAVRFHGQGRVTANGYLGDRTHPDQGDGGGGRIAIYGDFHGETQAFGGIGAGAGTIFRKVPDAGKPDGFADTLVIANPSGSTPSNRTPIPVLRNREVGVDVQRSTEAGPDGPIDVISVLNPSPLPWKSFLGMRVFREGDFSISAQVADQSLSQIRSAPGESFAPFIQGDLIQVDYLVDEIQVRDGAVLDLMGRRPRESIILEHGGLATAEPVDLTMTDLQFQGNVALWGAFTYGDLVIDGSFSLDLKGNLILGQLDLLAGETKLDGAIQADGLHVAAGATLKTPDRVFDTAMKITAPQMTIDGEITSTLAGHRGGGRDLAHGGLSYNLSSQIVGQTFGSLYKPTASGKAPDDFSFGGGAIHLIFDDLTLNGALRATSADQGGTGSIFLEGQPGSSFSGAGVIDASSSLHVPAAGGRVAIHADNVDGFVGEIRAWGRENGTHSAGAGTIFYRTIQYPLGKLVIDNNGHVTPPGTTPLPALGVRTADQQTGGGPVIHGDAFPDSLAGLYVVVDGHGPVRIESNTQTELRAEAGQSFPALAPGDSYSGLHQLDALVVTGGAQLFSEDPILVTEPPIVVNGGNIGQTSVSSPSTVEVYENGVFTLADASVSSLSLVNATVTVTVPLDLGAIQLSGGSTLIYEQVVRATTVLVDSGTLVSQVEGQGNGLVCDELRLVNGSTWTVQDRMPDNSAYPLRGRVSGVLFVDASSSISVSGVDKAPERFPIWEGTGCCEGLFGHGGFSLDLNAPVDGVMGSFAEPDLPGSLRGGGVIRLTAGELQLEGLIQADSLAGGSGGSIWIEAPAIYGHGVISAAPPWRYLGGGRIAVYYGQNDQFRDTLTFQTVHVQNSATNPYLTAAGTLFLKSETQEYGELIVDQQADDFPPDKLYRIEQRQRHTGITGPGRLTLALTDDDPDPFTITDRSWTHLPPGLAGLYARFTIDGVDYQSRIRNNTYQSITLEDPTVDIVPPGTHIDLALLLDKLVLKNGGQLFFDGVVHTSQLVMEDAFLGSVWARDLELQDPGFNLQNQRLRLILENPTWAQKDLSLTNSQLLVDLPIEINDLNLVNSTLGHTWVDQYSDLLSTLDVRANHVTMDDASGFDVSQSSGLPSPYFGGSNHGGVGRLQNGPVFGSLFRPRTYGPPSRGGGTLHLKAATLTGGFFRADNPGGSSGSAGSIWVEAGTLAGNIQVTADSHNPQGSGGRVAIYYDDLNQANLTYSAFSGSGSESPGTVFLKSAAQDHGVLVLDPGPHGIQGGVTPIPGFPPVTLGIGFLANYQPGDNHTELYIPGLDITLDNGLGIPYVADFFGYRFTLNGDLGQSWTILGSEGNAHDTTFLVEGDLSFLQNGDVLALGVLFDELRICHGCALGLTDIDLLDEQPPGIHQVEAAPQFNGYVLENEAFSLRVAPFDNVAVTEVRVEFEGQNQSALTPPFEFPLQAPSTPVLADFPATVTVIDHTGLIYTETFPISVGPVPEPVYGELLINGSAELAIPGNGWVSIAGDWSQRSENPTPHGGLSYFFAGATATAELTQGVPVGLYRTAIDEGAQPFIFEGWLGAASGVDTAQVALDFRGGSGQPLGSWDSGPVTSAQNWVPVSQTLLAPQGTRSIQVRLQSARFSGVSNDGYFDDLSLRALPRLTAGHDVAVSDVAAPIAAQLGDGFSVTWAVHNQGIYSEDVTVRLIDDTDNLSWTQSLPALGFGQSAQVRFHYYNPNGSSGIHQLRAVVDPAPGETDLDDNEALISVQFDPPAAPSYTTNLLVNPGAELPISGSGWVALTGDWSQRTSSPNPQQGSAYFFPGESALAELYQDINVSAFAAAIDAGAQPFVLSGWLSGLDNQDTAQILVEFRDATNQVLSFFDSGARTNALQWESVGHAQTAPAGTRRIRVRLVSVRNGGLENNGYYDALSLEAGPPVTLHRPPQPISYWSFDDAQLNGDQVLDVMGRNHGVNHGAVTSQPGVAGEAFLFSGQWVEAPHSPSLDLVGDQITLQAWVKPQHFNSRNARVVVKQVGANSDPWMRYALVQNQTNAKYNLGVSTGGSGSYQYVSMAQQATTGQWTHLVGVYDGVDLKIYVDGALSSQRPASGMIGSTDEPLTIGGNTTIMNEWFHGEIDEVAIWDQALTEEMVGWLFDEGANGRALNYQPPEPITRLRAMPRNDRIAFVWEPSQNTAGDLAGYRVAFDGAPLPGLITQTTWEATGLSPLTLHELTVEAVDDDGNVSRAVSLKAATLPLDETLPEPVSYWTLDDRDLAGDQVRDAKGLNPGFNQGATSGQIGIVGQAFLFDGQQVMVPHAPSLEMSGAGLTVATWVKPLSIGADHARALAKPMPDNALDQVSYGLGVQGPEGRFRFSATSFTGGPLQAVSGDSANLAEWTHLAGVYDGSRLTLFVNGQAVAQRPVSGALASSPEPLFLGGADGSFPFRGFIDEAAIWDQPLSEEMVNIFYLRGLRNEALAPDLDPPVFSQINVTPLVAGALETGQPFRVSLVLEERYPDRVEAQFDGQSAVLLGEGPYGFHFTAPVVATDTTRSLTLTAYDQGGLTATRVETLQILGLDTEDPSPRILSPPTGAQILEGSGLTVEVEATDNRAIQRISAVFNGETQEYVIDPGALGPLATHAFNWTVPPLANQPNISVFVTAYDMAGNHATAQADYQITSNALPQPVAYWTFDNQDRVGDQPRDVSGGHHAHFGAALEGRASPLGECFRFRRPNHSLAVDGASTLEFAQDFTLSAWVRVEWFYEEAGILTYGSESAEAWSLTTRTDNGQTIAFSAGGERIETESLATEQWRHIVVTFHRGLATLYVDGAMHAQAQWTQTELPRVPGSWLSFGVHHPGPDSHFHGYLNDTALWDQALGEAAIHRLHQGWINGAPEDIRPPDEVTDLLVSEALTDQLTLSWSAPVSQAADLAGYRVYVNDQPPQFVAAPAVSTVITGLAPFTLYSIRVASLDHSGNEAPGVRRRAATALANPVDLQRPVSYWTLDTADLQRKNPLDVKGGHHANDALHYKGQEGVLGQGSQFNHNGNHFIDVPGDPSMGLTNVFSWAAWIKPASFREQGRIFAYGHDGDELLSLSTLGADGNRIALALGSTETLEAGLRHAADGRILSQMAEDAWLHLAVTFDRGLVVLYLNGDQLAEGVMVQTSIQAGDLPFLRFGRGQESFAATGFNGHMDEVMLWDQALAPTTVALLHQTMERGEAIDFRPPGKVVDVRISPGIDRLDVTWTAPTNQAGDLDHYRVFIDAIPSPQLTTDTRFVFTGLQPLTAYEINIVAVDDQGNANQGTKVSAATLPAAASDFPQPVSYWTFENDDRVGDQPLDVKGANHANHGDARENRAGVVGRAFHFNSPSVHSVAVPGDPSLDFTNAFTISLWFRADEFHQDGRLLTYGVDGQESLALSTRNDNGRHLAFSMLGAGQTLTGGAAIAGNQKVVEELELGVWRHAVITFDHGNAALFLDGRLIKEAHLGLSAMQIPSSRRFLTMGSDHTGAARDFRGRIDEILFWDQALTPAMVALVCETWGAGQPYDLRPPEDVSNVRVTPTPHDLSVQWDASANSGNDLASYFIYMDDSPDPVAVVDGAQNQTFLAGLTPLSLYKLRIVAVDQRQNHSAGATLWAATLPSDPLSLPSPVSYWSFEDYDRSGDRPRDVMGRNHANFGVASEGQAGQAGRAFHFNPLETHRIEIPGELDPDVASGFTFSLWLKPEQFLPGAALFAFGDATVESFSLTTQSSLQGHELNHLAFAVDGAGDPLLGGGLLAGNDLPKYQMKTMVWRHVAVTFDQGMATLYLDGAKINEMAMGPTAIPMAPAPFLSMANRHTAGDLYFHGFLDEALFWDQALSHEAVALIHQTGRAGSTFHGAPVDFKPPAEVGQLTAAPSSDTLHLEWIEPGDPDYVACRVYLDEVLVTELPSGQNAWTLANLAPESTYRVRVAARDANENETPGAVLHAATLPVNPGDLPLPVSYWSFEDAHLNGNQILDVLGVNHSLTSSGTAQPAGQTGQAWQFWDPGHAILFDKPDLGFSDHFTLSLWFYATAIDPGAGLLSYGSETDETFAVVFGNDQGQYLRFQSNSFLDPQVLDSPVVYAQNGVLKRQIQTNQWYHLAITFDRGEASLYLNGELEETAQWNLASLPILAHADLVLGRYHPGTDIPYQGYLDEVALWNQALTLPQIRVFYLRGLRGDLVTAPGSAAKSGETATLVHPKDRIVLKNETARLRDFKTEKSLWLYNARLEAGGQIEAASIHLLEGSVLTQTRDERAHPVTLKARFIEIDPASMMEADGFSLSSERKLDPDPVQYANLLRPMLPGSGADDGGAIRIQGDALVLDGAIFARGGGRGDGGSVLIDVDLIQGSGLIDVSGGTEEAGTGAGGRVALHANNALDFGGEILTGARKGQPGSALLQNAGDDVVYLGAEHPRANPPEINHLTIEVPIESGLRRAAETRFGSLLEVGGNERLNHRKGYWVRVNDREYRVIDIQPSNGRFSLVQLDGFLPEEARLDQAIWVLRLADEAAAPNRGSQGAPANR